MLIKYTGNTSWHCRRQEQEFLGKALQNTCRKKKVNVILSSHDISAQNRKHNLKRQQQKSREHFELSIRQKVNNKNA